MSRSHRGGVWRIARIPFARFLALLGPLVLSSGLAEAQSPAPSGSLAITVTGADRAPLIAAIVSVTPDEPEPRTVAGRTDSAGRLTLGPIPAGPASVRVRRLGFADATRRVTITGGQTLRLAVTLSPAAQPLGAMRVVTLRGDLTPEQRVDRDRIAAVTPHDAADVLRGLPGTDAVRRGAIALDPVVRGLRDTQLGVYVDAARTFPGGPAGMDTPMSHVDPAHVQEMEVLSGPYALTWGAGNLSAIRVTTNALPAAGARPVAGRLTTGYDENLGASELAAALEGALGAGGRVRYTVGGAWREGQDYRAGDGSTIAAGFRSNEGRARIGVRTGEHSTLAVLGSLQAQRDIDYPGRPLDATYFDTYQLQAEWSVRRPVGAAGAADGRARLRDLDVMAYVYDVDHLMDNDDKPTALPDPTRMPPFAVDINTATGVRVLGGRVSTRLVAPGGWELEFGGDVYDADHDGARRVDRRDTGAPVRRDLIWGGARIVDAGLFTRLDRRIGRVRLAASARVDVVHADADSASAFFTDEYGDDLSSRETNWSGATTLRIPVRERWAVTLGLGSVVRTAEANERFSDRAAAKRAQTNAEFLGDPGLRPERSTQADVWVEGHVARIDLQWNTFVRRMDDYITIAPTTLPTAQPGSPPPVYRFVNGRAEYHGTEVAASVPMSPALTLSGAVSYLYGQDLTLREPALGVTPVRADLRARYAPPGASWFVEQATHVASAQERVATTRGERATPGWTTVDLQGGMRLWGTTSREAMLRLGVRNMFDRYYVHHLSALNAFGGGRLPEPGRVFFARMTVGW
jgi:iron complex outermembrane recepter protein